MTSWNSSQESGDGMYFLFKKKKALECKRFGARLSVWAAGDIGLFCMRKDLRNNRLRTRAPTLPVNSSREQK